MTVDVIEIESLCECNDKWDYESGYIAKVNGVVIYEDPLSVGHCLGSNDCIHDVYVGILAHYGINAEIKRKVR